MNTHSHEAERREHGMLRARDRYDDLIAYPEGGRDYEHEELTPNEFAWVMQQHTAEVSRNLELLGKRIPKALQEAQVWQATDLITIQLRRHFTWGVIGSLLDDLTIQYLREAYADTSVHEPGARAPSE